MRHTFWKVTTAGARQQARRQRLRDWRGNAGNPYSPVLSIGLLLIIAVLALTAVPA